MAGTPKHHTLMRAIEKAGGDDALLERIEQGETISAIAESLGCSRSKLSGVLNRTPEGKERLAHARETAAHALADESLKLARQTDEDNHRSNKVKLSQLNHLAGKWNRAVYGETPMVAVQVNVNELFLDALKQSPPPVPQHLVVEGESDVDNGAD